MRNNACHLPNGQLITVSPVFGGFTFKINDAHLGHSLLPPGWTIVLYTRRHAHDKEKPDGASDRPREAGAKDDDQASSTRFTAPTLGDDCLYLSAIVSPPNSEYKPMNSASRQIAMMLWVTLWWYFHEPEPDLCLKTEATSRTPAAAKPKGDWRVNIKREGIFKGRNVLQKLERMGLIATEDSSVGSDPLENESWESMFVSRRSFWQIDPRLFLFSLSPLSVGQGAPNSTHNRQLSSPMRGIMYIADSIPSVNDAGHYAPSEGPFASSSHLPTYFPPPSTQYTFTNGVRHPIRPKPPHQGDVFYIRYIPSVQQYLSFRVPYLPSRKAQHPGGAPSKTHAPSSSTSDPVISNTPSDLDYLHKWMNDPRVNAAWGEAGPVSHQEEFLRNNLKSRHSFPVIGCWDGKPFGYFEIYWVKEDPLGQLIGGAGNYDRGIHLLVGEQEFRGAHRVQIWLSALVHYCWLSDPRTETVMLEPRVDNTKILEYLQKAGFYKEGEVSFPHKQSNLMKIKRDHWEAPAT